MAAKRLSYICFVSLFLNLTSFLNAQTEEPAETLYPKRIAWSGGEYALRFAVEIDRLENGNYLRRLREFTTELYHEVLLPEGEYRFRILPHDILDRPREGTPWVYFVILSVPGEDVEAVQEIIEMLTEAEEQFVEEIPPDRRGRFNTLGVSVGTAFTDPLVIATLHGTFSPIRGLYLEIGCEVGFFSTFEDVERHLMWYPYVNIGYFLPFRERGGLFFGVGVGYKIIEYTFAFGQANMNFFGFNFSAGINLLNALNISYTLKTDFSTVSNKFAVGYIFRFR